MKVVHISYAKINEQDAERWLQKINFFCGVLESMAKFCEVWSIHSIDCNGEIKKNNVHYLFIKRTLVDGWFSSVMHQLVNELKPDVVIVHGLVFPWEVLLLQRTLSSTTRLFIQNHAERPFRSHKAWLQKLVDRNVEGYFFASHDLAKPWIEKRQIADPKKIHEVMEVSSVFKPVPRSEAQQKLNIKEDGGYLWVGRLNENKNPLLVVNSFLQFLDTNADAKLYLVFQENDLLPHIEKILNANPQKKKQIILVGNVNHAEMIYWYNSMNYIISTSFYEGSGVAICEAMSCGCIPILTDIPSFRMMTDNGRVGFLYMSNDRQALVTALRKSVGMKPDTRQAVLDLFNERLSFPAIAKTMMSVIGENNP